MTLNQWLSEFKTYISTTAVGDPRLEQILRETVSKLFGVSATLETTLDNEKYRVFLLGKISVYQEIAFDATSFFKYSEGIGGDSIDKSMIMDNILKLIADMRKEFNSSYPSGQSGGTSPIGKKVSWK